MFILPAGAVKLLRVVHLAVGTPVGVIPNHTELTTQQPAEFLKVSRPWGRTACGRCVPTINMLWRRGPLQGCHSSSNACGGGYFCSAHSRSPVLPCAMDPQPEPLVNDNGSKQ